MSKTKCRLRGTYVSLSTAERLKAYCASTNTTESAVIEAALRQYLAGTSEMTGLMRRLDQLDRRLQRLSRDAMFYGESLGEFVRVWYAYTPELPEAAKPAATLRSSVRYRSFVRELAKRIAGGRSLVAELVRDDGSALEHELNDARAAANHGAAAE